MGNEYATTGDLVYIPANALADLPPGGEHDTWVCVLVSPNLAHNKSRAASDYLPGTESLPMTVTRPLGGDGSAASNPFPADVVTATRGTPLACVSKTSELVYLVVTGECHVPVGALSGNLRPGHQVHVLRDLDPAISSLAGEAAGVRFKCAFVPFAGVELGPEAARERTSARRTWSRVRLTRRFHRAFDIFFDQVSVDGDRRRGSRAGRGDHLGAPRIDHVARGPDTGRAGPGRWHRR